jgi:hypothetical protein
MFFFFADPIGTFQEMPAPQAPLFDPGAYPHYMRLAVHYDDHLEVCQTAVALPAYLTYLPSEP